jgi:hypothetical protein
LRSYEIAHTAVIESARIHPSLRMIERTLTYPPADRKLYLKGWKRKYGHTAIFLEYRAVEAITKQIPVRYPPLKSQTFGFGELFAGIHYSNRRYRVTCDYWGKRWSSPSYFKAVEILGPEAADFICQSQPQPPDLFVVDPKNRFFFVEVKLPEDKHKEKQKAFCTRIERYLTRICLKAGEHRICPKATG